jgi:triosephosphate isomerase
MKYVIGNWKSNLSIEEAQKWIEVVKKESPQISEELKIVLCPSYMHLLLFKLNFPNQTLGSQGLSAYPNGTYTGAVSANMLHDVVDYAIVGHSERRTYFNESNNDVANQITQALDFDITPIIAVDDQNWFAQLSIIKLDELEKCTIMYEPPEAISRPDGKVGAGEAAPIEKVVDMIGKIKEEFPALAYIYGGSVKSSNIVEFLSQDCIDGVLPGSASLNPEEWLKMITLTNQLLSSTS